MTKARPVVFAVAVLCLVLPGSLSPRAINAASLLTYFIGDGEPRSGYLPTDRPSVVAGDCNFWGPGVEALLPGWRRAVRGRTWPARALHSQIDHVLTRRGELEVVTARVMDDVGSDHRAIRVELALP